MLRMLLGIPFLCALAAQETVTVEGRVIDAVTMAGVPGAQIVLRRSNGQLAVTTDDSGGFRFEVEHPSEFHLFANKEGYTTPEDNARELTTAKDDKALRSIEFKMFPEARLSGRVLDRATGKPVTGYVVYAEQWVDVFGGKWFMPGVPSEPIAADGSFHIGNLIGGEYRLMVRTPLRTKPTEPPKDDEFADRREEDYARTWYPGVADEEQAARFSVEAGSNRTGMDIRMERRRIASIRGRLIGPESTAKVALNLTEIRGTRTTTSFAMVGAGPWPIGEQFGFNRLSPGTYNLYASLPKTYAHPALRASRVFRVGDRNLDNLDLVLNPGLRLTGSVLFERPLPGNVTVDFQLLQRTGIPSPEAGKVDGKSGQFSMEGLEPGRGYFIVRGLPLGFVLAETIYNGSPAPFGILALDERAGEHKVVLKIAAPKGRVQITVQDGSKPVPGAMVLLVPDGFEEESLMRVMHRGLTLADGRASFGVLLPGLYRTLALPPGAEWTADAYLAQRLRNAQEVRVAAGLASISLRVEQNAAPPR